MNILLITTVIGWVIAVAIPIFGTYKSYKKLQNTRKKLKDQQEQRKMYEQYRLNIEIHELMLHEKHKIHPDIDTLRKIVANKSNLIFTHLLTAYELKLISEETALSLIEATMSPLQLYKAGNPLWTKPFTPAQIQLILEHKNTPNIDKIFK